MEDMEIPAFLKVNDEDDIHEEMLSVIPDEYDKSEGQHLYNFSRPAAVIIAQQRGQAIPEAIKLIWAKFSNGEYLDLHAEAVNIKRKEAQHATGEITITGIPGTILPAGYTVSTESKNNVPSQDYETLETCTIGEDERVTVRAQAVTGGSEGNTAANTIVVNTSSYDDVISINNALPFTGGTDEEDDDSLYARIREYNHAQGDRNTGNPSDYKRWAESVIGTGTAKVVRAQDASGTVTIILTDGNGGPASEKLCEDVYNFIMSPNDDSQRQAPCGASLVVIPPETQTITIRATVELTAGTIESVTSAFAKALKEYYPTAIDNGEILYQKVCRLLGSIEGVYDFANLTINGTAGNIPLNSESFPFTDEKDISLSLAD